VWQHETLQCSTRRAAERCSASRGAQCSTRRCSVARGESTETLPCSTGRCSAVRDSMEKLWQHETLQCSPRREHGDAAVFSSVGTWTAARRVCLGRRPVPCGEQRRGVSAWRGASSSAGCLPGQTRRVVSRVAACLPGKRAVWRAAARRVCLCRRASGEHLSDVHYSFTERAGQQR
jgi:hypothetical protein